MQLSILRSCVNPPFRYATPNDSLALAELADIAGEGMPTYLWIALAEPGMTALEVGQQRARRESGSFSYRNAIVREDPDGISSLLIGYPLGDPPGDRDYDEMPPMFVPLQQLEDLAPNSWYVNVLATYARYRGKGYGRELLLIAEQLAEESGSLGLSLIVSDANEGAQRLYERFGFRELATRPMVKESWRNPGQDWILLWKDL